MRHVGVRQAVVAEADVFADRGVQQGEVLRDVADAPPERAHVDVVERRSAQQHASGLWPVQADEDVDH